MKRCMRCVLPETFPGIEINKDGICNFCRSYKGSEQLHDSKNRYLQRFEDLLKNRSRNNTYDCLMAYSGGKDSTYTLFLLKEKYNLSICALTFDNGFISPGAIENIKRVVEAIGIDHILYKPRFDLLKKVFRKAANSEMYSRKTLERASTICTSCMGLVESICLRIAIESNIPFIAYGWSPGQLPIEASIFKNNPSMTRSMQKAYLDPMIEAAGPGIENFFLNEFHFSMEDRFPYNITPLAFLDYNEDQILKQIASIGWHKPLDTDPNSTNCLLNAFAIRVHKKRLGFHPYSFELAKLVREGHMDRNEALKRLDAEENSEIVQRVRARLEID